MTLRSVIRRISLSRWITIALPIGFMVLAGLYSVITPAYEAPDEPGHFAYALHLRMTGALPVQQRGSLGQSHQPPLYYAIAALVSLPADVADDTGAFRSNPNFKWPGKGNRVNVALHSTAETFPYAGQALALHLMRALSVVMGALTVALVIAIGRRLLPLRPDLYLFAAALIVVNPQFLFVNSAVTNDSLLTLAVTGIWWQTLRTYDKPKQTRQWVYLGLWISAAALAKFNGIFYGVVAGVLLVVLLARRRTWRSLMLGSLATSIVVVALSGWWYVRNQMLYGDLFGWTVYQTIGFNDVRRHPLSLNDPTRFVNVQLNTVADFIQSFTGRFGWMNVRMPAWFYNGAQVLIGVALVGLLVVLLIRARRLAIGARRIVVTLIIFALVAQLALLMNVLAVCSAGCSQGRYLFPVLGPLMLLISIGLLGWWPRRAAPIVASVVTGIMLIVSVWVPFGVIAPRYATPALPKTALWGVQHRTDFVFGQRIALRGYDLWIDSSTRQVRLTLYWQALKMIDQDYSAFVHALNPVGQIYAQADGVPGFDQHYPPTAWFAQDLIADVRAVVLPVGGRLRIGLYNWQTGERLSMTQNDQPLGNAIDLDPSS